MDRIGINPFLYEIPKLVSTDIDWIEDFHYAESLLLFIYNKYITDEAF